MKLVSCVLAATLAVSSISFACASSTPATSDSATTKETTTATVEGKDGVKKVTTATTTASSPKETAAEGKAESK